MTNFILSRKSKTVRIKLFLLFPCLIVFSLGYSTIRPTRLTCEYLPNPSVVDVWQPRLAWINIAEKGQRGQKQTAWQIRVASSREKLNSPDLWDSQKVLSEESNRIIYKGKTLTSRTECWWQVRVWDKDGKVSAWSEPAFWRMGLLNPADWKAEWIGAPWQGEEALPKPTGGPNGVLKNFPPPAPMFRKKFTVKKEVRRAVAYTTGLGYFEFYLNGQKTGDDVLVPNQTNYGKRPELIKENIPLEDNFREYKVMYLAYDIKPFLKRGDNVAGSILGNGFYNPAKYWMGAYGSPRFIAQIHITYTDGTEDIVVTDKSWKAAQSPILFDMVFYGEHYDARKELKGWSTASFNDAAWQAAVNRKAPEGKMVAHTAYTDKVTKKLKPLKITKTDSSWKVDFAEEVSGWVRLNNVLGPEGHKINIRFNSNTYSGDNSYIFSGKGPENYAPRFNWFVFSGVEIFNWPGELKPEHLTAEAVNTVIEETARFETSNPLFNDINRIWKRSQLDNMHGGIASDCPHRERAAYTGDGQVACVTVMHNFNAQNFYHKWIQDILGSQNLTTGYVPNGSPWEPGCGGGVAWGAAMNIMPWEYYLHYGAKDMLEDNYEGMKEYIRYMQTWVDKEGIMFSQATGKDGKPLQWLNLGDWAGVKGKLPDNALVHTFYLWRCADLTAKAARVLNKPEDVKKYSDLAGLTARAFHKRFYDETKGSYGDYGSDIFALKIGVPADRYDKVINAIKSAMRASDGHLFTGIFGTQFLFEILTEHGMHDLAYTAMNKRTMPSYGYWLESGSTTTREQWDNSGSHNHPMFGGGITWFYRKLAGMNADENKPGYKHIIFKPHPVRELSAVRYYNQTAGGEAGICWKNSPGSFQMDVTVPVGSTATIYVPAEKSHTVTENGRDPQTVKEVKVAGSEKGYRLFEVQSGEYRFMVK